MREMTLKEKCFPYVCVSVMAAGGGWQQQGDSETEPSSALVRSSGSTEAGWKAHSKHSSMFCFVFSLNNTMNNDTISSCCHGI